MLEIYANVPAQLIGKPLEEMDIEEFIDTWAMARYASEQRHAELVNAIRMALLGDEK